MAVLNANRSTPLPYQRLHGDENTVAVPGLPGQAVFVEVVETITASLSSFFLLVADDVPFLFTAQRQGANEGNQVRFTGAKFRLYPVALANGVVFPFRHIRRRHLAENVIQEGPDRINEKLFDGLRLCLPSLSCGIRAAVSPDMVLNDIDADDLFGYFGDLSKLLRWKSLLGSFSVY